MTELASLSFEQRFVRPPGEFRPMPLWVWNGEMSEKRILEMLKTFAEQGMGGVFVHPRPGLRTEYLSERWFELWKFAAEECRKLGLQCNIYDENSYPSGFAGGHVVSSNPQLGKTRVEIKTLVAPPSKEDDLFSTPLAIYSKDSSPGNISRDLAAASPSNPLEVLFLIRDQGLAFLAGFPYADLSKAETTDQFIRCTHEAYLSRFGGLFGDTIRYVFTDEPTLQSLCDYGKSGLVYSHSIEAEFRRDHGYGLLEHMNRLLFDLPDSPAVRFDYGKTLDRLFTANFVGRIDRWCAEHKLAFTGHFNEHHWPLPGDPPNVMTALRHMQVPGNDMLGFQFVHQDRETSEHFRLNLHELRSVASQFDKKRTLVEACGGGGYGFTLRQTKALEDFVLAHGVNLINPHLCYETLSGSRKYDWPQTFSDHTPWMDAYREHADHVARVAWALSQGKEINRILVLHPTLSSWLVVSYGSSAKDSAQTLQEIRENQDTVLNDFCHAQIDFDLGDELLIAEAGFVKSARFGVGKCEYEVLVLPATVTCLASSTVDLLRKFLSAGGTVLALCEPPSLVDGRSSGIVRELAEQSPRWKRFDTNARLLEELKRIVPPRLTNPEGKPLPPEICFRRVELSASESLIFFCNPWEREISTDVRVSGNALDILDTASGTISPLHVHNEAGCLTFPLVLPPASHALFRVSQAERSNVPPVQEPVWNQTVWSFLKGERTCSNILTLDYCDIEAHHLALKSVPTVHADCACWQAMGFHANIWYGAVQFRRNFVEASIPNPGPFTLAYRFYISPSDLEKVRPSFRFAAERANLYSLSCNGKPVEKSSGERWFDEEILSFPIESYVREGENIITLHAERFTTLHEIAPAYLLGNFATSPSPQGFLLTAELPVTPGEWSGFGLHFYKDGVRYFGEIDLPGPTTMLQVKLDDWKGSLARIFIDNRLLGHIWRAPFEGTIQMPLMAGRHEVAIEVVGNLKNVLGPHFHQGLPLMQSWEKSPSPQPPGEAYQFEANGLFSPPLIHFAS